jgi:hypothetical protein
MMIINQGAGSIHTLTAQAFTISKHLSRNHADATLSDLMKVPHSEARFDLSKELAKMIEADKTTE